MKPTDDDAQPRRDGWFEHAGTWGEVTVGTVIASHNSRLERWEIIEQRHGPGIPFDSTLWMRAREQTTGVEFTIVPRVKVTKVTILTQSPADTETPPAEPPSDAEAVGLLVEKLGATLLASHDTATGEWTCPDYVLDSHLPEDGINTLPGLLEHLAVAHGHPVPGDIPLAKAIQRHGKLHDVDVLARSASAGFPHRHVPEDLTIYKFHS